MIKKVKVIKKGEEGLTQHLDDYKKVDIVFRRLDQASLGRSSANPTWGLVFNVRNGKLKLNSTGEGLFKEFDYDNPDAAYAEKIASILGREILDTTRVPEVDVVQEKENEPSMISYRLMNNDKEDMFHISDLMFYKYNRDELRAKKNLFTIEDVLECVKVQVKEEKNYKEIERAIIHTLLLDSVINNGDRHNDNWALVIDKETRKYELAIFDHASTFVDMIDRKPGCVHEGWVGTYITYDEKSKVRNGDLGRDVIKYIAQNYREYFEEFCEIFNKKLPSALEKIKNENLPIDKNRLELKLNQRNSFLKRIKNREETEYGE